jgi:DNA repair protein RecN (Recombination protein N)
MLQKLTIQNYAIIEQIEINFLPGLTIITGETGAGKSILMGALGLILGNRADNSLLIQKDKKSVIEGSFLIDGNEAVQHFLEDQDFDNESTLLLRREIAPGGKSRAFINDSPATLQQLKQLTLLLVDIHQQFDTLEITESDFQRSVIDVLAGNETILHNYKNTFQNWKESLVQLQALQTQKNNFAKEADYHSFLLSELEEINLKEKEIELLTIELNTLNSATEIKETIDGIQNAIHLGEQPLLSDLKTFFTRLQHISNTHKGIPPLIERLKAIHIELKDISTDLDSVSNTIINDPERIEWINERIATVQKLFRKHSVSSTEELLAIQHELIQKQQFSFNIDDQIIQITEKAKQLEANLLTVATSIRKARENQIPAVAKKVNQLLGKVGMPNAALQIDLVPCSLSQYGTENIVFLFDANKSNRFEPISKVASGGELSRLMLCIKSLVAASMNLPTMIFDEIDTGISGEAAKQVGIIMKEMAATRQLICITHQAQIAGKATTHLYVYKEEKKEGIKTGIRVLTQPERVEAIAKMLGGEKPSAAALENAKEMMN